MSAEQVHCHPLLACARAVEAELRAVAGMPADYLRTRDKAEVLTTLARARAAFDELYLRVLGSSADVAEEHGARDAGAWLAHETRSDVHPVRSDLHLAEALESRPLVAAGMRDGSVNTAQARVIVRALEKLPADLDDETKTLAEKHLVDLAAVHDPKDLAVLGKKLFEVIDPDAADAELGKALEREEQAAMDSCSVRVKDLGNGASRITALVPNAIATRLTTYLDAEDSPRVTRARSRGQAFCRLLETIDPTRLPDHGGDATTLVVTISYETLLAQLGAATLEDGTLISATAARRLACTAKIIPAVLGGKGEVLDLGRARRFHTPAQRKAMRLRDQHCRAEGCTIPAAWCEAHHLHPWSKGGRTDLADGALLCSHHHHRAHDTRYDMTTLPTGDLRFHRRT